MSRHRVVDASLITPLHAVHRSRAHHLQELIERMREGGWEGRPVIVETTGRRYQAWTGTHRLAAARHLRMRVPILLIDKDRWISRWGKPRGLFIDEVESGSDMDKYIMLSQAGDKLAANVMHTEIELNLSADSQKCMFGTKLQACL